MELISFDKSIISRKMFINHITEKYIISDIIIHAKMVKKLDKNTVTAHTKLKKQIPNI